MTVTSEEDLERLKAVGHVCALARDQMAAALRPGITTAELDAIGARILAQHGARSAPQLAYVSSAGSDSMAGMSGSDSVARWLGGAGIMVAAVALGFGLGAWTR